LPLEDVPAIPDSPPRMWSVPPLTAAAAAAVASTRSIPSPVVGDGVLLTPPRSSAPALHAPHVPSKRKSRPSSVVPPSRTPVHQEEHGQTMAAAAAAVSARAASSRAESPAAAAAVAPASAAAMTPSAAADAASSSRSVA